MNASYTFKQSVLQGVNIIDIPVQVVVHVVNHVVQPELLKLLLENVRKDTIVCNSEEYNLCVKNGALANGDSLLRAQRPCHTGAGRSRTVL